MDNKTALIDKLHIDRTQSPARRGNARRWWAMGLGTAALIAVGVGSVYFTRKGISVHAVVAQNAAINGEAAQRASLLDASGYVVAVREATVSAKSIYKVEEVLVQEGQTVKQGELMARLDDTNVRATLEQSKAQVKQLEVALSAANLADDDARPSFLRNQIQFTEGLISAETLDASKATYDAVKAAVAAAEQNLVVARAAVNVNQRYEDDTLIKAPFDGVVTVRTAQPGEIVSPQFLGGGGIAKVVDMNSLEVDVDVSENYINRVHSKQPALVTLNAYPDWQIPAHVIAVIPTADRSKATVKVRIGFERMDARIVPEMGVHVSFLEQTIQNNGSAELRLPGVVVPTEAVQVNGESAVVFVINGATVERRAVRLGTRLKGRQTIQAGLKPGMTLAIGDFNKLGDGARIRIIQ